MWRGWAGGSDGFDPAVRLFEIPVASSRLLVVDAANRQLRLGAGAPPGSASCRNEATVRVDPIWMTRSRSPTSIPSSRVEVATMTVSRAPGEGARSGGARVRRE